MIAAILRAQLLSMRPGAGRGFGLGVVLACFWYGFWLFVAWWAELFASYAGAAALRYFAPICVLAVCLYWQAMPVLSASMGSSLDLRKLLLYPAPHDQLFVVELLLRFTNGIEMQMVLLGAMLGLARNPAAGGLSALPRLLAVVLLVILFNVLLSSGTRSLLERLLARRRVREIVAFLLAMIWVAPRFIIRLGIRIPWLHTAGEAVGNFGWPWSAAARAALPLGQASSLTLLSWLSLAVWTLLAGQFGRTQFERSLHYDTLAAQATPQGAISARRQRWTERLYRFPSLLWSDPLAAIVEKELRTLTRSPRFRMVFVMGFTFGLMLWLPMVLRPGGVRSGGLGGNFLVIVCVYAMSLIGNVTYWNCLGIDRSAAVFYFVAPQPISRTLLGKNIACLLFVYLEAVVLVAIAAVLRVSFGMGRVLEAFLVVGICATYLMALGNISSVRYPRALSPERVSQGGGANRARAVLMIFYPVVLLPVLLAYLARFAFDSETAFGVILACAGAIGLVFYRIAMESAVKAASDRRQQILEELSRGDGPVGS